MEVNACRGWRFESREGYARNGGFQVKAGRISPTLRAENPTGEAARLRRGKGV